MNTESYYDTIIKLKKPFESKRQENGQPKTIKVNTLAVRFKGRQGVIDFGEFIDELRKELKEESLQIQKHISSDELEAMSKSNRDKKVSTSDSVKGLLDLLRQSGKYTKIMTRAFDLIRDKTYLNTTNEELSDLDIGELERITQLRVYQEIPEAFVTEALKKSLSD